MSSSSDNSDADDIPSPSVSVAQYLAHLQSRVQPLTRTAGQLPGPSDLSFHRSLDRSLRRDLDATSDDLLNVLNTLLGSITGIHGDSTGKSGAGKSWNLRVQDLIEEGSFKRAMGDVIDSLLERADNCLDEVQGKGKAPVRRSDKEKPIENTSGVPNLGPLPSNLVNANIQPLPQLKFRRKPDNSRERMWKHGVNSKPHAQVPLTWKAPPPGPGEPQAIVGTRQGMYCAEGDPRDSPYYFEVQNFEPPEHALTTLSMEELLKPPSLEKETPAGGPIPFLWVDDEATFGMLLAHLSEDRVQEIAIDVEHHNYRSFQGLVCLVQISTRWRDYIIDALSPTIRDISSQLNQVFADPRKVKILHGAEHDILWLQRDLDVYIVGLFDTYHATNVLNFPQHSLAFLLKRYVSFEADKRYQLADWRIRPLHKEMLFYARSDTHSLIYVYDCLKYEIEKLEGLAGISKVFQLSKRTASRVYAKEEWDPEGEGREGWKTLWKRLGGNEADGIDERWASAGVSGLRLTERLFRALHDWRDRVARIEDESSRYVLPANNLLNLASRAPTTLDGVIPCVGPAFKKRAAEVARLIASEVKNFEKAQKERGDQERAQIRSMQVNGHDEEVGEVVSRDDAQAAKQTLWPVDEVPPPSEIVTSPIASLLFAPAETVEGRKGKPVKKSLFASVSKATSNARALHSIRSELTQTLRGILGVDTNGSEQTSPSIEESAQDRTSHQPEMVPFVPKEDRLTAEESNKALSRPEGEQLPDTTIVKVKKASSKKRRESEETSSPKQKKARWTSEEKQQRKKEKEAATQLITPFDYSTAKSILDAKPSQSTLEMSGKKKDKKGKGKKEDVSTPDNSSSKKRDDAAGRYATISVRRDRREQQGGKSMSFSY